MRRRIFAPVLCFVLFSLTPLLAQEEFSADFVDTGASNRGTRGRIFVDKDKMRFEAQGQAGHSGVIIINYATQTSDVLMPERKMYMESSISQSPGPQRTWNFFRALDVDNACSDWQKMVQRPNGTCRKVGSDTVNGRSTVKYEGTSANGEVGTFWLDKSLRFPIKWEGKNNGGELQNIKEGSQPASLFEVPSDYQKFQMPAGMPGMPGRPGAPPQHP